MASVYEVAAEFAVAGADQADRADNQPAPEFTAKLRASLEAQELAQQLRRRQVKLYALLTGLLTVGVLGLLLSPTSELAGWVIQQPVQLARLLAVIPGDRQRRLPSASQRVHVPAESVEESTDFADEPGLDEDGVSNRQAPDKRGVVATPIHQVAIAATNTGARAQVPATQAALLNRRQGEDVRIGGSRLTLLPLTPVIEASRGVRSVRISRGLGSDAAFKEFCGGQLDVVATSRPIARAQRASCAATAIDFIELPVAYAAIAILANHDNVWADPLTLKALVSIVEGSDAPGSVRWNDIDGDWPWQPLTVHVAREGWSVPEFFDEITAGRKQHGIIGVLERHRDAADVVAAVQHDSYAIAAIPYGYYAANEARLLAHAKVLKVVDRFGNLVRPSLQSIVSRYYDQLSRVLFVYVNAHSALDPKVRDFVAGVIEQGSDADRHPLLVTLEAMEYQQALQNLRTLKLGSAFEPDQFDGLTVSEILQRNASSRQ